MKTSLLHRRRFLAGRLDPEVRYTVNGLTLTLVADFHKDEYYKCETHKYLLNGLELALIEDFNDDVYFRDESVQPQ